MLKVLLGRLSDHAGGVDGAELLHPRANRIPDRRKSLGLKRSTNRFPGLKIPVSVVRFRPRALSEASSSTGLFRFRGFFDHSFEAVHHGWYVLERMDDAGPRSRRPLRPEPGEA